MVGSKKISEFLIKESDRHFHNSCLFNVGYVYIMRCINYVLIYLTVLSEKLKFSGNMWMMASMACFFNF